MNRTNRFDVSIVGAGIIGLAHAYHFARAGLKVGVFEKGLKATGASVRNFGMVWPIGQPPGEMRETAIRSREIWIDVLQASGIWHERCGSLHLAYHADELEVLEEFAAKAPDHAYECEILGPDAVLERSPVVRREGLLGALWSPSEVCVFPRKTIADLPAYLETLGIEFHFGQTVTQVDTGALIVGGETIHSDRIVLCTGDEFETLFPARFAEMGMTRSKLQMMRVRPSQPDYRIGAHLCAGLTLGHYANFRICDSLAKLTDRYAREMPEYVEEGIHLLVSQHADGLLTVGDSHEYGLEVTPFTRQEVDRLILAYLNTFLSSENFEIVERWFGVYAKHPTKSYVTDEPRPHVHVVTGVGGAGMTLSFGLAERQVQRILAG